jgi:small-conductance mechanosensitive channel
VPPQNQLLPDWGGVRFGDSIGFLRSKSLRVTHMVTTQNEVVTIPDGNILVTSALNYTQLAKSDGLILTVDAGIGYDVDWRTANARESKS